MLQHFTELNDKLKTVQRTTGEIQRQLNDKSGSTPPPEAAVYVTGGPEATPVATPTTMTIPPQSSVEGMSPIRLSGAAECTNHATREKDFDARTQSTRPIRRCIDGANLKRSTTASSVAPMTATFTVGAAALKRQDATDDLTTVADRPRTDANGSTANAACYQF